MLFRLLKEAIPDERKATDSLLDHVAIESGLLTVFYTRDGMYYKVARCSVNYSRLRIDEQLGAAISNHEDVVVTDLFLSVFIEPTDIEVRTQLGTVDTHLQQLEKDMTGVQNILLTTVTSVL